MSRSKRVQGVEYVLESFRLDANGKMVLPEDAAWDSTPSVDLELLV